MSDDYSKSKIISTIHAQGYDILKHLISEFAKNNRFQSENPFVLVDLGCADSKLTIFTYKLIIEEIMLLTDTNNMNNFPVVIYLNDLIQNDWNMCISNVTTALENYKNIYVYISAKNFYEELFPQNTVDLFLASNILYYLSSACPSTPIDYHLFPLHKSISLESGDLWLKQSNSDLDKFFKLRTEELRKNGFIFVIISAFSDELVEYEQQNLEFHGKTKQILFDLLSERNLQQHKSNLTLNQVIRTVSHYHEWFDLNKDLSLLGIYSKEFDFDFYTKFLDDNNAKEAVDEVIIYFKAWSEKIYLNMLTESLGNAEMAKEIIHEYYSRVTAYLVNNLATYPRKTTRRLIVAQK